MRSESRLRRFETTARPGPGGTEEETKPAGCGEFFGMQSEHLAPAMIRGCESDLGHLLSNS